MLQNPVRIKVIITDDHPLIREGFKSILTENSNIDVIAEANDGAELLKLLEHHQPDVVLLDIMMPVMCGIEASRHIKNNFPAIKIIALSMSDDDRHIQQLWQLNVKGYLLKDAEPHELLHAVKTVFNGGSYYSEQVWERISYLIGTRGQVKENKPIPHFSDTEIKVMIHICKGLTSKESADQLKLAKKTIDHYKENIMRKAGCKNSTEVAVYAVFNKIVLENHLN